MGFPQPYPPTPIDYEDWNTLLSALEARFGLSAAGYMRDRTRVVNSRGNIWAKATGNIQLAIEDVLLDGGGTVWLPKGKITETSGWVVDEAEPVYIKGTGMCWHGEDRGSMIEFSLGSGEHCIDYDAAAAMHFGGLFDFTIYPTAGNRDAIHLKSVSDWHMDRVYINQAKRYGLHVEAGLGCWNLWVKDNLIENTVSSGLRLDSGSGSSGIIKSYVLSNYFYGNALDIEIGALSGTAKPVRLCQFHNNQHFNSTGIAFKMYRLVSQILVMGGIFYNTIGDAIDIDDDGAGNKCQRITIGPINIDGGGVTPNGVDLQGYTDHVVVGPGQIFGVTGTAVNEGVNTTNIQKTGLYES